MAQIINQNILNKQLEAVWVSGPITQDLISSCLATMAGAEHAGAYISFMGVVRKDRVNDSTVVSIEYTTYKELGLKVITCIKTELIETYRLAGLQVLHSIGEVQAGDCCFFVAAFAGHRHAAFRACEDAVNRIKSEVPIWGLENLDNATAQWKKNNLYHE